MLQEVGMSTSYVRCW